MISTSDLPSLAITDLESVDEDFALSLAKMKIIEDETVIIPTALKFNDMGLLRLKGIDLLHLSKRTKWKELSLKDFQRIVWERWKYRIVEKIGRIVSVGRDLVLDKVPSLKTVTVGLDLVNRRSITYEIVQLGRFCKADELVTSRYSSAYWKLGYSS